MTGTVRKSNGSDEDHLVELAFQYVTNQGYPEGCSDGRKRTIRRKAKKFEVVAYLTIKNDNESCIKAL